MSHYDDATFEQSERDVARLAVIKARVFDGEGDAAKHAFRIHEINAVFANIGSPFGWVPSEPYL